MGLIDFIKGAGEKLFNKEASAEEKSDSIYKYLGRFNLQTKGVSASFNDETNTVKVIGTVDSMLERKRIVATLGNIDGVEHVNDELQVLRLEHLRHLQKQVESIILHTDCLVKFSHLRHSLVLPPQLNIN